MNKLDTLLAAAVGAIVVAAVLLVVLHPQLGGDFAGGIAPNNLWTANTLSASVSPVSGTPNIITSGNGIFNDVIQADAGFSQVVNASTTLTPGQFCGTTSVHITNTTAAITLTLPAATTTYVACGSPAPGAYSQELLVNDSTNTVTVAAGTGMTLMNQTQGPGTTTIAGVINTIPATSTELVTGIWASSSSFYVMNGDIFH
jgi:hypothetical protein